MDTKNIKLSEGSEASVQNDEKVKKYGCWAKFKSFFEDRGFDLEFEYNDTTASVIKDNQSETEGYRKLDEIKSTGKKPEEIVNIDGELSGVIHFYEQFATLSDDPKEEVFDTKRRSTIRHRVSMRPSILLTNIAEETGDGEFNDVEEVRIFEQNNIKYL
ncbi:unnamed protein product [Euphydryas editha]|uniref:Uncharacterized protein n=1 Tax=Euphydryas editha TaxID=104508 RepID=A0AAU9TR96_EUPED|nr:unnamed protein product [Euphydryas editha]